MKDILSLKNLASIKMNTICQILKILRFVFYPCDEPREVILNLKAEILENWLKVINFDV